MCFSLKVIRDLNTLANQFSAKIDRQAFQQFHHLGQSMAKTFKAPDAQNRIFPNYFSPIITMQQGQKIIRPMRYRLRPAGSPKEVPAKYNLFNARRDSLWTRQSWKTLLGHNHGLIVFEEFYEWVPGESGKSKLVSFRPKDREFMWAPCLFDYWQEPQKKYGFYSFAIITDRPNPEIVEHGHERCPLFLKRERIEEWLQWQGDHAGLDELFNAQENVYYQCQDQ